MKKQAVLTGYTGREENKMNEMQKKQKIVDYINSIGDDELIALHNTYCCAIGNKDRCIYSKYNLDKALEGRTPTDILRMGFCSNFSPRDRFFWINDYDNLESAGYAVDAPIYVNAIAGYAVMVGDNLNNNKIQEILNED